VRTFARPLGTCAVLLALAACIQEEVGYIEVRAVPASATVPLYLDTVKLEPLKSGVAVVRHRVGTTKLQTDRGGQLALLCDIIVRKHRITTVTVSILERPLRCQCRNTPGPDRHSNQSCIS
jgi:hypothetical protein